MKHYLDYKKLYKLIFSFIILGFFVCTNIQIYAQTAEDLQNQINQRNNDIANLEKEIKSFNNQLNDLSKQKDSLNVSLQQLDLSKKQLTANISVTQKKIENTNSKINTLSSQIGDKQDSITNNTEAIKLELKNINEVELNSIPEILISENNFSDIWNDIDNISTIQEKIRTRTKELQKTKNDLEDTKKVTTDARNELVALKTKLADQKKIVDQNTAEKKKLLADTKNNEANYQILLKDRLAKKDAFEADIRNYESQLKYILDPKKLPGKGVLSWPLDNVYVTQMFGKTEGSTRLYASGTHNGTDFRAAIGTPVKAMADGVVAGTNDTDLQCKGVSFGKLILIKYDNGLASTYGHLSLIKVSIGERVSRGEVVGYSGNSGYSTGPHLHVSMYPKDAVEMKTLPSKSCPGKNLTQPIAAINAYLDPMYYLPSYK
ncbi:MAG: peptidoglycan DD-metalloendopeptidase family protein [Candidatus Nomurabacteria bacterium]|nr:peptidoglycan DD-metalloendopeptidase family protein [Candidatus Nomurabacteria bacterium]